MINWARNVGTALLVAVSVGCGGTAEIGPVTEDKTPKVSQEEIHEQMRKGMQQGMQNMNAKQKQMMESRYMPAVTDKPAEAPAK